MMTKIKHLEGKYKPKRPEPPSEWEGILISEEKLRAKFEDPKIEAPNYANIQLSEGEKKAAALGPKFTTYETITKHKIDVAAEVLVTKLRWESRSREEREGEKWSEEWEWDQVKEKIVFDEPNGTMDYSKQRVTDLPTNRRTTIPPPGKVKEEIVYANMKSRIDTVRENYVKKKCDEKGNIKASNVDTKTKQGIKSLQDRAKKGELLVVPSDKSGKLCVNSVENYVAAMEPHIKNDPVITLSDKNTTERVLNGTTLQLGRILKMGENHNHWDSTKHILEQPASP